MPGAWITHRGQRRISAIVSGEGELSSSELADVEMHRTNLSKQIEQFRELQVVYMPGIVLRIEQEREAATGTIEAEDDKLWFPSDLSKKVRNAICHPSLGEKEGMLREAQCWDSLVAIRSSLRAEASLHDFQNANLQGQEALMHVSDVLEAWKKKWELAAKKYWRARSTVLTLRGAGPWTYKLRELTVKDMSSMYGSVLDTEETQKKKKTNWKDMPKEVSWIWLAEGSLGELRDDSDVTDVHVHWLRSRARLKRWEEEVALLREEQRRVLVTLRYRVKWWDSRRSGWDGLAPEIVEGLRAYAAQQHDAQLVLASNFASKWPSQYVPPPDDECDSDDDMLRQGWIMPTTTETHERVKTITRQKELWDKGIATSLEHERGIAEKDGILYYDHRVYIPRHPTLRGDIIAQSHDHITAAYIAGCETCQRTKSSNQAKSALLDPNAIPMEPWTHITIDMITSLPDSNGYDALLVVVDRFSKAIIPVPCNKDLSAEGWARILQDHVYARHGMPQVVISDRGPQFVSKFMMELYRMLDIKQNTSTAFHPQTDRQMEQVNQEIEKYLHIFINFQQDDWADWLLLAEFAHNNRVHSATGKSPFMILYGRNPRIMPDSP
ncbi:uncharacterized protein ARMOST_22499 [Armillaria ostoyae]|uniref:Integrase catalytic domain-containing protein n=1 Tax=Armillaria ostoyae TaxID=47428 RepID=A0A284SD07_ARMOS|nr:uncharacterized protein ARMOST_22499 [Armillaria ostoyae]